VTFLSLPPLFFLASPALWRYFTAACVMCLRLLCSCPRLRRARALSPPSPYRCVVPAPVLYVCCSSIIHSPVQTTARVFGAREWVCRLPRPGCVLCVLGLSLPPPHHRRCPRGAGPAARRHPLCVSGGGSGVVGSRSWGPRRCCGTPFRPSLVQVLGCEIASGRGLSLGVDPGHKSTITGG
jgi:hypothetical protein